MDHRCRSKGKDWDFLNNLSIWQRNFEPGFLKSKNHSFLLINEFILFHQVLVAAAGISHCVMSAFRCSA